MGKKKNMKVEKAMPLKAIVIGAVILTVLCSILLRSKTVLIESFKYISVILYPAKNTEG